ncbi:aminodeoxychorismate synthase component I [Celerinatantimonas diazotrophica]|nr:aminodeoxychorismate synthase component I [Celerinatantimonas diazotrophica]
MLKIAPLEWSQLLQTSGNGNDRYSIAVADPIVAMQTSGQITTIETPNGRYTTTEEPFLLCQQLRQQWLGSEQTSELPFCGGLVGAFGYELGRAKTSATKSNLPDFPDMLTGLYDWALIFDRIDKNTTLVVNTTQNDGGQKLQQRWQWLNQHTLKPIKEFSKCSPWQGSLDQRAYESCIGQIKEYLESGDCYQVNMTQQFYCNFKGDLRYAYQQLLSTNQVPFAAYLNFPQGTILSLSPERFIKLDGQYIETKPIKGTRPRHSDPALDQQLADELSHSIKDRAENVMIVDLLRNDIGQVSQPGSVQVPKLFAIESFKAVHHLVSTVTGKLNDNLTAEDLLHACFPGGSITGAPKVRAMEIIDELEPHRRSIYCGAIGYISQNAKMDTNIAIRTLVAHHDRLYVWAGGGIVADSKADEEYQECFDKLAKILPVLESLS